MECEYCSEDVSASEKTDEEFVEHLATQHSSELSTIDQRRVEQNWDGDLAEVGTDDHRFSAGQWGLIAALGSVIIGLAVINLVGIGGGADSVTGEEGSIQVLVDGEPLEFAAENGSETFQIKPNGDWVMDTSKERLTIREGLLEYGINLTRKTKFPSEETYLVLTTDGQTFTELDDGTRITLRVNREHANPRDDLFRGDAVNISVTTGEGR